MNDIGSCDQQVAMEPVGLESALVHQDYKYVNELLCQPNKIHDKAKHSASQEEWTDKLRDAAGLEGMSSISLCGRERWHEDKWPWPALTMASFRARGRQEGMQLKSN